MVLVLVSLTLMVIIYYKAAEKHVGGLSKTIGVILHFLPLALALLPLLGHFGYIDSLDIWDEPILIVLIGLLIVHLQFIFTIHIPYWKNKDDAEVIKYTIKQTAGFTAIMTGALIAVIIMYIGRIYWW